MFLKKTNNLLLLSHLHDRHIGHELLLGRFIFTGGREHLSFFAGVELMLRNFELAIGHDDVSELGGFGFGRFVHLNLIKFKCLKMST